MSYTGPRNNQNSRVSQNNSHFGQSALNSFGGTGGSFNQMFQERSREFDRRFNESKSQFSDRQGTFGSFQASFTQGYHATHREIEQTRKQFDQDHRRFYQGADPNTSLNNDARSKIGFGGNAYNAGLSAIPSFGADSYRTVNTTFSSGSSKSTINQRWGRPAQNESHTKDAVASSRYGRQDSSVFSQFVSPNGGYNNPKLEEDTKFKSSNSEVNKADDEQPGFPKYGGEQPDTPRRDDRRALIIEDRKAEESASKGETSKRVHNLTPSSVLCANNSKDREREDALIERHNELHINSYAKADALVPEISSELRLSDECILPDCSSELILPYEDSQECVFPPGEGILPDCSTELTQPCGDSQVCVFPPGEGILPDCSTELTQPYGDSQVCVFPPGVNPLVGSDEEIYQVDEFNTTYNPLRNAVDELRQQEQAQAQAADNYVMNTLASSHKISY